MTSQAENASSILVARSRLTSQVTLGFVRTSLPGLFAANSRRAPYVPQRALRRCALSATQAENRDVYSFAALLLDHHQTGSGGQAPVRNPRSTLELAMGLGLSPRRQFCWHPRGATGEDIA